jgi:predicted phosphodiesterase
MPPLAAGDVLVYGHTHIPVAEKRGDIFLFNPARSVFPKGISRQLWPPGRDRLQVLALDDHQVIAEVAINP